MSGGDDEWGDDDVGAEWVANTDAPAAAEAAPEPDVKRPVGPDAERADRDAVAAMRTVWLVGAAAALAVLGVVAVVLAGIVIPEPEVRGGGGGQDGTEDPVLAGEAVAIGPASGVDVAAYSAARADVLASATGVRVAVVSLAEYAPVDAADATVTAAAGGPVEVLAHLVAVPGGAPEVVVDDLAAWAAERRAAVQAERDEIARLLPTVEEGSDFIAFYEEELRRFDGVLANLDPAGALVFAVVVRADAEVLRTVAAAPGIRLVDVGASGGFDPAAGYSGLRPEEGEVAGSPDLRP